MRNRFSVFLLPLLLFGSRPPRSRLGFTRTCVITPTTWYRVDTSSYPWCSRLLDKPCNHECSLWSWEECVQGVNPWTESRLKCGFLINIAIKNLFVIVREMSAWSEPHAWKANSNTVEGNTIYQYGIFWLKILFKGKFTLVNESPHTLVHVKQRDNILRRLFSTFLAT